VGFLLGLKVGISVGAGGEGAEVKAGEGADVR